MARAKSNDNSVRWFNATDAARIGGLTVDMVNYLCRYGIVLPSADKDRGRGKVRKYTYGDLLLLRVIGKLLSQGISVMRLRKCLKSLQKRGLEANLLTKKYVATDGLEVYFGNGTILEQLGTGQTVFAFIIELRSLRKEVAACIVQHKVA